MASLVKSLAGLRVESSVAFNEVLHRRSCRREVERFGAQAHSIGERKMRPVMPFLRQ
jgi:hypothetical protein